MRHAALRRVFRVPRGCRPLDDRAHCAEQCAIVFRRFAGRAIALDARDQRAQALRIAARVCGREERERARVGEQLLAPAPGVTLQRHLRALGAAPLLDPRADRRRIDLAHQPADVLQLAAPAFEIADALRFEHRFEQDFGQPHLRELRGVQLDELRPGLLERVHFAFAPSLAWPLKFVHRFGRHESAGIIAPFGSLPMSTALEMRAAATQQFAHDQAQLRQIVADTLSYARERGASACECESSEGFGQGVTVRRGEVETIEYNRDKALGVTVYLGQRRGHASSADFSAQAMRAAVDAALSIARFTASDDFAGLADEDALAREIPELDLYHPWDLPVERAIELARACEDAAFAVDKRITNSEGATVSLQQSHFAYGNSLGFLSGYAGSRHWMSCAVIAGKGDAMQRDDWYASARDPAELETPQAIGRMAGERAVKRLGARKIATAQVPVLFEAPVASGLLGHFVSAVSGGSLYRKSSFLVDSLGRAVFAPWVELTEDPLIPKGLASGPFDEEGVAAHRRKVVDAGVVQGYFLGSYSARKLGMKTTGNAGGNHNLLLGDSGQDLAQLLREMGRGLLVTELLGHGINLVTGDYSRGAAGFWVENGTIAHPVQEITIAGNLKDIFRGIVAAGNDIVKRGSKQCGSVLIERMTVAGD